MTALLSGRRIHPRSLRRARGAVLCSLVASMIFVVPATAQDELPSISDLAWIAGTWAATTGTTTVEEHWTTVASNGLLGMGRTLSGNRMVSFEFLRIIAREDGIFYIAQPSGRSPTEFKLTKADSTMVVFENPDHDFPKRVVYTRQGEDAMTAWVDSGDGSNDARSFTYGRVQR